MVIWRVKAKIKAKSKIEEVDNLSTFPKVS